PQPTTTVAQQPQSNNVLVPNNQPTDTDTVPETTAPPTTTTMNETTAGAALLQQVASNHTAVEQLVGKWVPELSAKKPGLVADGVTYNYQAILADYQKQAAQHSGALLLKSDDYTSFKLPGFWVTVVPQTFSTAAA